MEVPRRSRPISPPAAAMCSLRHTARAPIVRESALDDTASSPGPNPAGVGQYRQGEEVTMPLRTPGDLSGEDTLVRDFMLFKSSAAPSRVLFFAGGVWNDFPAAVVEIVRGGFLAGKAMMDVPVGSSLFLFDFVRLLQIDVATSARSSVAWIDVNGRCFFPKMFTEGSNAVRPKLEVEVRNSENGGAVPSGEPIGKKNLSTVVPLEEHSDESQVIPAAGNFERPSWSGVQVLDEKDRLYNVVKDLFLAGMRRFAPETTITSIQKCSYGGPSENGRMKAFLTQMEMTKAARGAANVRVGWYGASASGITSIISHGFGQPNNGSLGPEAQAVGVYLAPQNSPHASSLLSEPDDVGEKHLILCRIIMGNIEKVDTCSTQSHPSSDNFDCGADDLEKPRWYIIWNTHMNTHIFPEYVVSFKTSVSGPQVKEASGKGKPGQTSFSFAKLFAEISNSLPSSKIQALETLYERFKAQKIPKDVFLKNVRTIAGDKLLTTTIRRYHNLF